MTQPRRGSGVSDKNIRLAVQKGRMVEASVGGTLVEGYISGLDDYHISLIPRDDPQRVILLPKGSVMLTIFHDRLLSQEQDDEKRKRIEAAIDSFRRSLAKEEQKGAQPTRPRPSAR